MQARRGSRSIIRSAEVYADYRELLARDDIDIVDIVVPSHLHHEIASAALAAGKHVLLEKPMALSLQQCDDLIRLARESNERIFAVGHELRLSSLWGKVKELIDAGFVGDPLYALVELSRRPYRQGSDNWRYDIKRVGSWILEEPIHFFDLARWYLSVSWASRKRFIATSNSRQPGHPELKDNFSAIVHFPQWRIRHHLANTGGVRAPSNGEGHRHQGRLWASWSGAMDRTLHPTVFAARFRRRDVQEIQIDKITGEVFELEDQMAMLVRRSARAASFPAAPRMAAGRWQCAWPPSSRWIVASRSRWTTIT